MVKLWGPMVLSAAPAEVNSGSQGHKCPPCVSSIGYMGQVLSQPQNQPTCKGPSPLSGDATALTPWAPREVLVQLVYNFGVMVVQPLYQHLIYRRRWREESDGTGGRREGDRLRSCEGER